jgi:predicted ATPase/serine phosphatase RsbU (regulator of sigma subunit)
VNHAVTGYTLTQTLRETQSAILLRGTRDLDGTAVIVKLLRAEHPTPTQIARLRHEHAILSSLDLPDVVQTFGLVKHGRGWGLVLEDLGDQSLDSIFRRQRPTLEQFLDIAIRMTSAVAAIHGRAVIHKDVKPHHFLMSGGSLKLIDFGIATRLSSEAQGVAHTGVLDGTLAYMSPEQTGRMNRSLDRRTDLYSLGVAFYELLTGRVPFEASDPLELVHAHIARRPRAPHELSSSVPRIISEIVLKLMAKGAEDRYQSAAGLKADLEEVRTRVSAGVRLDSFPLGRGDVSGELSIPQKLYGRQAEVRSLQDAFARARAGSAGLLLISGYSGVGKSALVNELQKEIVQGGAFVTGKFDQLSRSVPFSALVTAARGLVRSVLGESPAVMTDYARRLREALGRNGKLIADLVPELEVVLGPQPAVQPLGPAESQGRFELVFRQFLQVFARPAHPLVLFLDDLQWADAASLRMVREILVGGHGSNLLLVGAYRSNEAAELHTLRLTLEEIRKAGVRIDEVALRPLTLDHVVDLLGDTLRLDPVTVRPLAQILVRKTDGNPFFVQHFLGSLHEQQLLRFDVEAGRWSWDDARIEAAVASDNVVELLVARLRRLSPDVQRVLTLAACVGQEFDLATLSLISQSTRTQLASCLWGALREGVLIPLDGSYRYLEEGSPADEELESLDSGYRFLHDRVQQAAYELLDATKRNEIHLRIGRLLLAEANGADPDDETLFEVVRQMNLGRALVVDGDERLRLARLNLRAGLRVAASGAHSAALDLLKHCLELLGPDGWDIDHQTMHRAHLSLAECEILIANSAGALQILDAVEAHARTTLERAAGRAVRIIVLQMAGRLLEAVACGVDTARILGAEFPSDDAQLGPAIGAELGALQGQLATRTVESLLDLPEMADPEKRALVDVLFKTNAAAFMAKPPMSVLIGIKAVRLAIEHGNAPKSPYFYGNFGIINNAVGGDLDVSYRFGKLGVDLVHKNGCVEVEGSTYFLFGGFNCHWRRPIGESIELLRHAVKACLETGTYLHAAWAEIIGTIYRYYRGENIQEVLDSAPRSMDLLRKAEYGPGQKLFQMFAQTLKALAGETVGPSSLDDDGFDESAYLTSTKAIPILHVYYNVLKQPLAFLAGDPKGSLALATAALPVTPGMYFGTEHGLYRALAQAALLADAPAEQREAGLAELRQQEATLRRWADACPANHGHRPVLLAAEIAALADDQARAMDLYEQATKLAREAGFIQYEALANELAAKFHLRRNRTTAARAYMREAFYGYRQWGAKSKTATMTASHPSLLEGLDAAPGRPAPAGEEEGGSHSSTTTLAARGLDLVTAVRATQALAGELDLGNLLQRLMRTMVENAGAQKGILVLDHGGRLEVEALITVDPNQIRLSIREPVEQSEDLPASVVQYVARSKETLVFADATTVAHFARDPYIVRRRPKSMLCLAMLHQGRLVGVLYLENNAASNAFSIDRVELLQFVAAQAGVAVENANLYGELRAATEQLRRSNDNLEAQVAQRTKELERTLTELWSEMDLARKIQTVLLPGDTQFRDYEVSAMMVPASTVGGDYYDIIRTDGSDWLLIGDVSGHGVTAGLTMMMIQTAIRTVVLGDAAQRGKLTPAQVLSRVNAAVRSNLQKVDQDHYMTITGLQLEGSSVRYSGLHQDILIYRAASQAVERVATRGMWIGPVDDIGPLLRDDTLELSHGDTMLLYTDGITEAMIHGQRLGTEGLASVFGKLAADKRQSGEILKGIMQTMDGTASDDVTMMAVRYVPEGRVV